MNRPSVPARVIALMGVLVAVLLVAVACSSPAPASAPAKAEPKQAAEQQPLKFKFGSSVMPNVPQSNGMEKFAKLVGERTNGKVQIDYIPGGQLGGEKDIVEGIQLGTIGLYHGGYTGSQIFDALWIPYLFKDLKHMDAVAEGPLMEEWNQRTIKEKGLRVIGVLDRGVRQLTSNKEINSIADLKGLKIRTAEIPIQVATWKALGASPTPLPMPELFTSLQQGIVDAQENPLDSIMGRSLYEVQKYIAMIELGYPMQVTFMDERIWQKMTPETQKIFMDAFEEGRLEVRSQLGKFEEDSLAKMKEKGVKVLTPDIAPFREATKDVGKDVADKVWGEGVLERLKRGEAK